MFTRDDMLSLLSRRPFVPFRLHTSDGSTVDVPSPESVLAGRRFAVVGLLGPGQNDTAYDRYATVWYMHVTRVDWLSPGMPPFTSPPPSGSETPSPTSA